MKKSDRRTFKEIFKIYGAGVFIAAAVLVVAYQFVAPAPPKKFTIATASKEGAYYGFAKEYRKYFAEQKIELEILETSGSVENIQLLKEKQVQVAFVQGGVGSMEDAPDLRGLASLYLEPLFIFARAGLDITTITDLKGKRIGIGLKGSGTRKIVLQLLSDNGMEKQGMVEILPSGGQEGARELLEGEIDALFMVTNAGTPLVERLFHDPRVELVNLRRAKSYSVIHNRLSHIVLSEGVLDMASNIPSADINFIAPAATLVASDELHPALIDLLMQVAEKVHKDRSILGAEITFPSPEYLDFPLSAEADRFFEHGPPFLQRYLPFWAASLIDRLKFMLLPLVALILPLMKVLPPTYRWRIRSRIYRWYDELHELDVQTRKSGSNTAIAEALQKIKDMEEEVRLVEVPLSYAEELYNLRLHIDLLRRQWEEEVEQPRRRWEREVAEL